ncbi:MAG: STAS domain-containing protein [Bacteroidia bacterium]|nr:STAS domain-containing protein [Bacteroidia bacterium]
MAMQENLTIEIILQGKMAQLLLQGRLDANWAGHLDEHIEQLVRSGIYDLSLDTSGISYISSAGIRILVKQYKHLHAVGGSLSIESFSAQVSEVLEMAGMLKMFGEKSAKSQKKKEEPEQQFIQNGYRFFSSGEKAQEPMKLSATGNPAQLHSGGYSAADCRTVRFPGNTYALGIGAIGSNFEDCRNRFGEFIAVGEAIVYLPSDNSGIPDYTVKTGKMIPEIQQLYALTAEGHFTHHHRFESDGMEKSIGLSALLEAVIVQQQCNDLIVLMVAESGGLVGSALRTAPVDSRDLFNFPEIRDQIAFTTEPAHTRMLTLTLGFISREPSPLSGPFLRKLAPLSALSGHLHTAVFPYQTLKKGEPDSNLIIRQLFEESKVIDILHLTHDYRDIQGIGESQFIHGHLWCAPLRVTS